MRNCPICGEKPAMDFPDHGGTVIACIKCIFQDGNEVMVSARVEPRPGEHVLALAAREQQLAKSLWNGLSRMEVTK